MFNFLNNLFKRQEKIFIEPTVPKKVYTVDVAQLKEQLSLETCVPTIAVDKLIIDAISKNISSGSDSTVELPELLDYDAKLIFDILFKNREIVYKYVLQKLNIAVTHDFPSVDIFKYRSSNGSYNGESKLFKTEYDGQLNTIMQYYIRQENYEIAADCRDLIRKLKKNDAVDQQL